MVSCVGAYHGLTMGALSLGGMADFKGGFGPYLPGCEQVPYGDLESLETALSGGDVAAFFVEPILGHGVEIPPAEYLPEAARICREYGTLLVADEVQTGLGRTGKMWAVEHWDVEPDLLCTAKGLSGGFVPVGAVLVRRPIFDSVFDRMDRAVVHGSTFGKNNLAMAGGLATLEVLEKERLVERAEVLGRQLVTALKELAVRYEMLKEARGLGLMLALEFAEPKSMKLKASWKLLEAASPGLFGQMITVPLLMRHRVLSQVAGHAMSVVKFLPPLVITDEDVEWIVRAVDDVVADSHRVPGAMWDFGKTLASQAVKSRVAAG